MKVLFSLNFLKLGSDNFVDEVALCATIPMQQYPKQAKSVSGVWKYLINTKKYKQVVSSNMCQHSTNQRVEKSCQYGGVTGRVPEATECKQLYWNQEMLSISRDGVIEFDTFSFPSVCACHTVDDYKKYI